MTGAGIPNRYYVLNGPHLAVLSILILFRKGFGGGTTRLGVGALGAVRVAVVGESDTVARRAPSQDAAAMGSK